MDNPYRDSNLGLIQAMKDSGPGVYNGYDASAYQIAQGDGSGLAYTCLGTDGLPHTYYFTVVVGENVDENSTINIDAYGSGVFSDGKYLDDYTFNNQGTSTSIDIRPAYEHDPYGDSASYSMAVSSLASDIAEVYGIDSTNTTVMGYSNTAQPSLIMGSDMALSGTDNVIITCVEVAGDTAGSITLSDERHQALIDHNATILNLHAGGARSMTNTERYPNWQSDYDGVHLIDVNFTITDEYGNDVSAGGHGTIYKYLVANGITDVSEGVDWENLPDTWYDPAENKTYHFDFSATEWYRDENGNYVSRQITDKSELSSIIGRGGNVYKSDVLKTDFSSLQSSVDTLKKYATQSSFAGGSKGVNCGFSGDTDVPVKEPPLVEKLLSSITSLMNKINGEAAAIEAVGERVKDLDIKIGDNAKQLNMDLTATKHPGVQVIDYGENKSAEELLAMAQSGKETAAQEFLDNKDRMTSDALYRAAAAIDLDDGGKYQEELTSQIVAARTKEAAIAKQKVESTLKPGETIEYPEWDKYKLHPYVVSPTGTKTDQTSITVDTSMSVQDAEQSGTKELLQRTMGGSTAAATVASRTATDGTTQRKGPSQHSTSTRGAGAKTSGDTVVVDTTPANGDTVVVDESAAQDSGTKKGVVGRFLEKLGIGTGSSDSSSKGENTFLATSSKDKQEIRATAQTAKERSTSTANIQFEDQSSQQKTTADIGTKGSRALSGAEGQGINLGVKKANYDEKSLLKGKAGGTVGATAVGGTTAAATQVGAGTKTASVTSSGAQQLGQSAQPANVIVEKTAAQRLEEVKQQMQPGQRIAYDNWDKNHEYPYLVGTPETTSQVASGAASVAEKMGGTGTTSKPTSSTPTQQTTTPQQTTSTPTGGGTTTPYTPSYDYTDTPTFEYDPTPSTPTVDPTPSTPTVDPTPSTPTVDPTPSTPTVDPTPGDIVVDPTPTVDPTPSTPIVDPTPSDPTPTPIVQPVDPTPVTPSEPTPVTPVTPSDPTPVTPVTPITPGDITPSNPTVDPSTPGNITPGGGYEVRPGVETGPADAVVDAGLGDTITIGGTEDAMMSPLSPAGLEDTVNAGELVTATQGERVVATTNREMTGGEKDLLTASAIATGVGLAAGAVAMGVSKKKEEKATEKSDEDYKYEYETTEENPGLYTEVNDAGITAFTEQVNGGEN